MERSAAVITLSDRAYSGERKDASGPAICEYLSARGWKIEYAHVIDDDEKKLRAELLEAADERGVDLVITTGGTGLAPRDITPETTLSVANRPVPGIAEAIRAESMKITKHVMLSRGVAVIRKRTLIINLPGSPKACIESLDVIIEALPHAIGIMRGEKLDK